jgi:hypothetical protein
MTSTTHTQDATARGTVARGDRRVVLALVVWTFFVWTARIGNIWRDDSLDTAGKVGRTLLAASFTVLALAVVATWRQRRDATPWQLAVLALAGWTTAVWLVRGTSILLAHHDAGFKAVHTVLAIVSIGLSAWAVVSLRRQPER